MEIQTTQKFIHTTPRKLRLVADMVRKMDPNQALVTLRFTPKLAAKDLSSAIKTVLGNAKQVGLDSEKMIFKSIEVNEGPRMRRFRAGARGRANPYRRKMAHIKIILTDDLIIQNSKIKVQNEKENKDKRKEEAK